LVFRENSDADLPGRNPDDEGENDRSLTNRTPKPTAQPGTKCQSEFQLIQLVMARS
jgi:hypothetical protein